MERRAFLTAAGAGLLAAPLAAEAQQTPKTARIALVFANGFFVSAEFAIVTVRKTRIDQMIAEQQEADHASA